jgi:malonate-semialdehyde dehydrogenase (acetylating)/methylmalonate-semialdehyde dehydrogenase
MLARVFYKSSNPLISAAFSHRVYKNFINNEWVESKAKESFDVKNPVTQEIVAKSPNSTKAELDAAVEAAAAAYKEWSHTPIMTRQKYMFQLAHIIRRDVAKYAAIMTEEHGKTKADAHGDVIRGLEVVEHACGTSQVITGETIENISRGIDSYYYRVPLGVCAGICPFNFPLMIPLWMFPLAITCGNTYVLKPSEKVGGAADMLTHAIKEIGLPKGVFNIVHGGFDITKGICEHPKVKAISFVGGNRAGEFVYETGSKNGKRVQSNMGAKNHGIVMPDADKDDALNALCNAAFGASGQRCMALSVAVLVGDANNWIPDLVKKAKTFKIGPGN